VGFDDFTNLRMAARASATRPADSYDVADGLGAIDGDGVDDFGLRHLQTMADDPICEFFPERHANPLH
jgi:hypothetical protein